MNFYFCSTGQFHHTPGKYSVLHPLHCKAKRLICSDDMQLYGISPRMKMKKNDSKDDMQLGTFVTHLVIHFHGPLLISFIYQHRSD